MHDAIKQAAADVAYDAKMRQPYVTMHECDRYMDSIHGVSVPQETIAMRKNADGVWEAKKRGSKKTD